MATGQGFVGNNMFAYCLNNPVNFVDRDGKNPEAACAWMGSMWWLCGTDLALPIGDIVYVLGIVIIGALCTSPPVASVHTGETWDFEYAEIADDIPQDTPVPATKSSAIASIIATQKRKKPANLPSAKKLTINMEHIKTGHMPGGSRNQKGLKSVFYGLTAEQIRKAIIDAYNSGTKWKTQGDRILVRGYSDTYELLIEIWVNIKTYIIETAYPL